MEQDNFTNLTISQNAQIEQLVTDFRNDPKRSSRVRQITFPKAPEKGPPSVVQWSVPGMKKPNKETIDENGFLTIFEHCRFVEKIFLIDWSFVSLSDDTLSRLRDSFAHVTTFEVGFEGHFKPTSFFCLLCLMTSLRNLSFLGNVQGYQGEMPPPPTFRLRSLSVDDDCGVDFNKYSWLLHSSTESMRELHLGWIDGPDSIADLLTILPAFGPQLKRLSVNGCDHSLPVPTIISHCPHITVLVLGLDPNWGQRNLKPCLEALSDPLQRLSLLFPYSVGLDEGTEMYQEEDVVDLIEAVRNLPALSKLCRITFHLSYRCHSDSPVDKLRELEALCKGKGVDFIPTVDHIVSGSRCLKLEAHEEEFVLR